ncbi:hypothetical protein Dimus_005431 [Dionaea muscipula]
MRWRDEVLGNGGGALSAAPSRESDAALYGLNGRRRWQLDGTSRASTFSSRATSSEA